MDGSFSLKLRSTLSHGIFSDSHGSSGIGMLREIDGRFSLKLRSRFNHGIFSENDGRSGIGIDGRDGSPGKRSTNGIVNLQRLMVHTNTFGAARAEGPVMGLAAAACSDVVPVTHASFGATI